MLGYWFCHIFPKSLFSYVVPSVPPSIPKLALLIESIDPLYVCSKIDTSQTCLCLFCLAALDISRENQTEDVNSSIGYYGVRLRPAGRCKRFDPIGLFE